MKLLPINSFIKSLVLFILLPISSFAQDPCLVTQELTDLVLTEVAYKNPEAVRGLHNCLKFNHSLILKATIIDPAQFQYAADPLKGDESFLRRIMKVSPEALEHASKELRSNHAFMEEATYVSRDSLKYASPVLTDNKIFMRRMITIDSLNYKYASERLKELPEFAKIAFRDDGLLLEFAPEKIKNDIDLVRIATKSNQSAIKFASEELQQKKEFKFTEKKLSAINSEDLEKFLQENYVTKTRDKNLLFSITGRAKNFSDHQIINRNYIIKWRGDLRLVDETINKELRLVAANSRNYQTPWKEDFKEHPEIIKKIENFLSGHDVDKNAIESLLTTFFWKIKDRPNTFAFNLYLLRNSNDKDFGAAFSNITSLTAIVQKQKDKWEMTVVEVLFDKEIKTEVSYENGHKRYVLWDLYKTNKNDNKPKIIFKVEDRFKEYFELFEEQSGGKYKMTHRFTPEI